MLFSEPRNKSKLHFSLHLLLITLIALSITSTPVKCTAQSNLQQSERRLREEMGLQRNNGPEPAAYLTRRSDAKSATGLASLPVNAQGPISAALGKDDSAYWVRPAADGLRGENPRHALTFDFTKEGAQVRNRNLRWSLQTRAYGYGNALHPVESVAPVAKANRVEYRRDGATEWYENGPSGLEQGFTLEHRPSKANGQPLTVKLALHGDLAAAIEPGNTALELRDTDGKVALRYTGLKAMDATGRELRSWLEVSGDQLLVHADDSTATYPITVDPWVQQAELTASDVVFGDGFGWSVAIDGSTAVVGSFCHVNTSSTTTCAPPYAGTGAAYVFVESGGVWTQQAELTPRDGASGDEFGWSVAISGGTIVVGAPYHAISLKTQGAAYVFVQSGTTWSQLQLLVSLDGEVGDRFGTSVAVVGSTAIVGAPCHVETPPYCGLGAAYVFTENGGIWNQQAELTASDGVKLDQFGSAVALVGGTTAVAARCHPDYSICGSGAVYVFAQSGTTWSQQAELTASDGVNFDAMGSSLAFSGNTIVAGSPNHAVGGNTAQGAAYVFVQSGTTWSQQAELTAADGKTYDSFGTAVGVNSGEAVVGAYNHTVGSNQGQGAAYVFTQSGSTWSQQAEFTASDGGANDWLGNSVAISGSTAIVGAPYHLDLGEFYVYSSASTFELSASPTSVSVAQGAQATSTITITPQNGFSGSVTLSAEGLPNGVTASFSPNPATGASTMTLAASATATAGTSTVTITGTSGSLTATAPLTLMVTGTATTIALTPSSLNFGNVAVDTTSAARAVTLTNTGATTLDVTSVAITEGNSFFAISSNTCGATLSPGKKCTVKVTFSPAVLAKETATLSVTDNASGSPQTVSLSGTGVVQANLTPGSYTFPKTKVGDTSLPHNFTLKNNLATTLTGISFSTEAPFAVSTSTCSTTLESKKSCTISVTFSPFQTSKENGALTVNDSANNSAQTSSLSGTGD